MSNFDTILIRINDDLNAHKGRDRNQLLTSYIQERLDKSLKEYYRDLSTSITYLQNKDPLNLMRKVNRSDENDGNSQAQ